MIGQDGTWEDPEREQVRYRQDIAGKKNAGSAANPLAHKSHLTPTLASAVPHTYRLHIHRLREIRTYRTGTRRLITDVHADVASDTTALCALPL